MIAQCRYDCPPKTQLRARVEGSRWRLSSFGWSPLRWFRPWTKVLRVSASTAPMRVHYRYDFAPARHAVVPARPEPFRRSQRLLDLYAHHREIHDISHGARPQNQSNYSHPRKECRHAPPEALK
eukprot:scaffold16831_cov127-Isochrysis_galbana.AAC.2